MGLCGNLWAEEGGVFHAIDRLDTRDSVFKQYLADVELARRRLFGQNSNTKQDLREFLQIYSYTPKKDEDIFRLSARCNIPYASLATLNRIANSGSLDGRILLPTMPGLFIPENPGNDLELLISLSRNMNGGTIITVNNGGQPERFLFFPGADFMPTERSFFLNRGFSFPLRSYRITSPFGMRSNPFTGRPQNHNGLDLAAPTGTEVYAARAGRVADMGTDPVLGNYIVIAHADNWVSIYGHLSSFSARQDSSVTGNTVIGRVGSTGQSTGPHLHFELRKNGTAMDPGKLLFRH
ncbi:MAG: M23 family metallopeptidase [Treponema sp.]|nr:M23 family metallopeptidase [Treponema sp.]